MKKLSPCASDRLVDAYDAARTGFAEIFPAAPYRGSTWDKMLHEQLCAAVEAAYIEGIRVGRVTRAKPRRAPDSERSR